MFLSKEYNITLSEIRQLPYFKYEWIIEEANTDAKEAQKQREIQEKQYASASKLPKYQQPQMPKFSMPKF